MKKKLIVVITALILCFSLVACGNDSNGDDKKEVEKPENTEKTENTESEITSIEGSWKCVDMSMEEGESKLDKEEFEEMLGMKADEVIQLTAYGDGTGDLVFFGDEAEIVWTEEEKDKYQIKEASAESEEDALIMDGVLKDSKLSMKVVETYTADDVEMESIMNFEFEHQGKVSMFFKDYDLELSDKEVLRMSNFMITGQCIVADGILYGNFGGESVGKGSFSMVEINEKDKEKIKGIKEIEKESLATFLTEDDGYIYGILNNEKIIKLKAGASKLDTIYEGGCDYLQIVGDKIYYTDENYNLLTMGLDGKNKTQVIDDREMYFTYVLPNDKVLYQHDSDNESLYMYDLETKENTKLNDNISYCPIIHGDYLYYTSPEGEEFTFNRLDLYSGNVETAPGTMLQTEFIIENGKIVFGEGGLPTLHVDEWNKLSEGNFGGMVSVIFYSDGNTRVYSDSNGQMYLTFGKFNNAKETTKLGYNRAVQ